MARLLLVSLVFPPDNVSTAQLMGELVIDLGRAGHEICVITTVPHYNPAAAATAAQPLRAWLGPLVRRSSFDGTPVYHVWVPRKGRNLPLRLLGWGLYHLVATVLGLLLSFRPQVILAPSPPLTIGLSVWLIAALKRARFIYNIQEIYPDVAINLGIIRSRAVIRTMLGIEQFVYRRAAALTTISAGMRQRILDKGVPPAKVRLIPNFVDMGTFTQMPRSNDFSRQHGLEGKFVVSYAGNMGKPQALDNFLHAWSALRDVPGLHLLMVGSGSEFEPLAELARELALDNVTFLPQQPYAIVPLIYASSDLSVVSQSVGTHFDGIPSKVYRIMGSGRAVLAITEENSDLGELVKAARAGIVVPPDDATRLATQIRAFVASPREFRKCGKNGREFVVAHYERAVVSRRYSDIIDELAIRA